MSVPAHLPVSTGRPGRLDAASINDTAAPFPEDRTFHQLFEAAVARVPDRVALAYEGTTYTYAELNQRANQLAHRLRTLGVGPDVCVAMCLPRSAEMIIALVGILKAGGAYVPVLPESPKARLQHQLGETKAPVVITLERLCDALPEFAGTILCLDRDAALLATEPTDDPPHLTKPHHLVYVIYTSGSTGTPKGVMVRHENLVNYSWSLAHKLRLDEADAEGGWSFATVSTLAADLGNTCIFPALMSGGALHVIGHDAAMDPEKFAAYCRSHPIDVLKITPSHLGALMTCKDPRDVLPRKVLVTGGEASSWGLIDKIRSLSKLRWVNHYGPTETTIGSLTLDLDLEQDEVRKHAGACPIGRPIANTRVYILDDKRQPVPFGEPGELYIAGRGVTAGYIGQPERTAERFLPEHGQPDGRMYSTGDRVKQLPNGAIEFLGRADNQVKVRGFRVELGEIEVALRKHARVRETVVMARPFGEGDLRIVAYYVLSPGELVPAQALREHVASFLPEQMVPSIFVPLQALPLTLNGKVDKKALPDPGAAPEEAESVPPADELERKLTEVWRRVLGVRRVGADDNFFEIGGHSLAAMHMLAEVGKVVGSPVPNHVLFHSPTIAGIARYLRGDQKGKELRSLVPIQPDGTKPPLFLFHGGGGEVFVYRDLVRRLGTDQPVFGLQARREDDGTVKTRRVEDMAAYYVDEIRQVKPKGPYYLGGLSFGGKVAYRAAQLLTAAGEQVPLTMMFDTWGPGYPRVRPEVGPLQRKLFWLYRRVEHHVGSLMLLEPERRVPYLQDKLKHTVEELGYAVEDASKELSRKALTLIGKTPPPDLKKTISFVAAASEAYDPTPYDGRVVLFRNTEQPLDVFPDRTLGWGPVARNLEVIDLPGYHATMIAEPRLRFLVAAMVPMLEAAQAQYG